jgi:hypothetical protein
MANLSLMGGIICFIAMGVFSCIPVADPSVQIEVRQSDGKVSFTFSSAQYRWWSDRRVPGPTRVHSFTLSDSNWHIIWSIGARDAQFAAYEITYGILPNGFEQSTPKKDRAPELSENQRYHVTARYGGTGSATFIYKRSYEPEGARP